MRDKNTLASKTNRRQFITTCCKGSALIMGASWLYPPFVSRAKELVYKNFQVDPDDLCRILKIAGRHGCDFTELFLENRSRRYFCLKNGIVSSMKLNSSGGTGIRVMNGLSTKYAFVDGFNRELVKDTIRKVAVSCGNSKAKYKVRALPERPERQFGITNQDVHYDSISNQQRLNVVLRAYDAAKETSNLVDDITVQYSEEVRHIQIANNHGLFRIDTQPLITLSICVHASNKGRTYSGIHHLSVRKSFKTFKNRIIEQTAAQTTEECIQMLNAISSPHPGIYPVILSSGTGGRLLHDTLGYALRANLINANGSCCRGLLNRQIAPVQVNLTDNGTCIGAIGSSHIDDEGTTTNRTELIKNGKLKNYMTDIMSARQLNITQTGNGRRGSYCESPSVHTTNFFLETGQDNLHDMLSDTPSGFYCKSFSHIAFDPESGDFRAHVKEAYKIIKGKTGPAIQGIVLKGNILEVLQNIDKISNKLILTPCINHQAKIDIKSIPYSYGQPDIRIQSIQIESGS